MNALTSTASPAIGHNSSAQPPLIVIDLDKLHTGLSERYANHLNLVGQHIAAQARFAEATATGVADDDAAARYADWAKQLSSLSQRIDAARTAEKDAPLAAGRAVDAFFKGMTDQLADIRAGALKVLTRHAEDKERRRREEMAAEAQRKADEAVRLAAQAEVNNSPALLNRAVAAEQESENLLAAAQATPAAALSRTRGDLGGVSSLRTTYTFEVEDISKVPPSYLLVNEQMVRAAIRTAPKKAGVPQITIPGIRVVAERKAVVA